MVGANAHIRRPVEGGARVLAGDGRDGGEHVVLNKRTREHDADLEADTRLDDLDHILDGLGIVGTLCAIWRRTTRGRDLCLVILNTLYDFSQGLNIQDTGNRHVTVAVTGTGGVERLRKLNVLQLVRLLIVDHDVCKDNNGHGQAVVRRQKRIQWHRGCQQG